MAHTVSLPVVHAVPPPGVRPADYETLADEAPPPYLDRPAMLFDVHYACNQTCSYCVSGSSPRNDFGAAWEGETHRKLRAFFAGHGPFTVIFTGGEPLITPGIFDFMRFLGAHGHRIALQSNLKARADQFADAVPVEDCAFVMTTFHSVELARWPRYLRTVTDLKRLGYPLVVKLVLDGPMLERFDELFDTLASRNVGVFLAPLVHFPHGQPPRVESYSIDDWARMIPRMTMRASWLYFAGGFHSRGRACDAGRAMYYLHTMQRGDLSGCAHQFPHRVLGNALEGRMLAPTGRVACGLERCVCDLNYYSGVVPGLDDRAGFARLMQGRIEPTPFEAYQAWVQAAGIEPIHDLADVVRAAGEVTATRAA